MIVGRHRSRAYPRGGGAIQSTIRRPPDGEMGVQFFKSPYGSRPHFSVVRLAEGRANPGGGIQVRIITHDMDEGESSWHTNGVDLVQGLGNEVEIHRRFVLGWLGGPLQIRLGSHGFFCLRRTLTSSLK